MISPRNTMTTLKKTATTPKKSCMKSMTDPSPRNDNTKTKNSDSRLRFLDQFDSDEDDMMTEQHEC